MADIELGLRFLTIGQLVLLALIMGLSWKRGRAVQFGALLALCVIAYLCLSSPTLRLVVGPIRPAVLLFAVAAPFVIWAFALSLFEEDRPLPRLPIIFFSAVILLEWITASTRLDAQFGLVLPITTLHHIVAFSAVGHAIYCTLSGVRDDLAERRRRFRTVFVILIALQSLSILIAEFVLGYDDATQNLSFYNSSIIAVLTLGFCLSFLGLRQGLFLPTQKSITQANGLPASERALHAALIRHMENGGYCETGLTISALAAHLKTPEHRLRRLINQSMGFRNFSAFLNSYRLKEAQVRLSDADNAHIPILTIAMDLGYASIAPFNRAFKNTFGMTPKDYRQNSKNSIDFETDKAFSNFDQTD